MVCLFHISVNSSSERGWFWDKAWTNCSLHMPIIQQTPHEYGKVVFPSSNRKDPAMRWWGLPPPGTISGLTQWQILCNNPTQCEHLWNLSRERLNPLPCLAKHIDLHLFGLFHLLSSAHRLQERFVLRSAWLHSLCVVLTQKGGKNNLLKNLSFQERTMREKRKCFETSGKYPTLNIFLLPIVNLERAQLFL